MTVHGGLGMNQLGSGLGLLDILAVPGLAHILHRNGQLKAK